MTTPLDRTTAGSLTASEQIQLVEWNRTDVDFDSEKCVHDILDEQATRTPESLALICRDQVHLVISQRNRACCAAAGAGIQSGGDPFTPVPRGRLDRCPGFARYRS